MRTRILKACSVSASICALAVASAAYAQDASAQPAVSEAGASAAAGEQLPDIVVTAQRRSERLQNVPITASAFSGDSLRNLGVTRSDDIASSVPNLVTSGAFDSVPKYTLRGIGTNDYTPNVNPAVGTYVDEVYIGLVTAQRFSLFDVQRVEVLRGPQGTLYGKNTTGGAINYITNRPQIGVNSGMLSLGYGNYDTWDSEGYANVALGANSALRVSGIFHDANGYANNPYLGKKQNASKTFALRGQMRFAPNDAVDINLSVHGGQTRADLIYSKPIGFFAGGADIGGFVDASDPRVSSRGTPTHDDLDNYGGSLTGKFKLSEDLTLTSVTGYENVKRDSYSDNDNGPRRLLEAIFNSKSNLFSQEFRLNGDFAKLHVVAGLHYYQEKLDVDNRTSLFPCIDDGTCPDIDATLLAGFGIPGFIASVNYMAPYVQHNRSYAAFGQATYSLTDKLGITVGGRYTSEKRRIAASSTADQPVAIFPGYALTKRRISQDNFSYKITLDYKPTSDILFYGTYSTGFKAPNFNGFPYQSTGQLDPVSAETLKSGEVGVKTSWFNRKLQLNLAAFYNDYTNLQVFTTENITTFLRNAGAATIKGGELEITALPAKGLQLTLGAGYTDATYDKFDAGNGISYDGNSLPFSPKWTLNGALQYERPLTSALRGVAVLNTRYQSKVYFSASNADTIGRDTQSQDGYFTTDARLGVRGEKWSLFAYAKNLFDVTAKTDGSVIGYPFGFDLVVYNRPRTYGLTGSVNF